MLETWQILLQKTKRILLDVTSLLALQKKTQYCALGKVDFLAS